MKAAFLTILCLMLVSCSNRQQSALDTTLLWSRMEALPITAEAVEIETTGSSFSREFEIVFQASEPEIRQWLEQSAGTRTAEVSQNGDMSVYKIKPGGGAQFAEVTVNWLMLSVSIRTFWS